MAHSASLFWKSENSDKLESVKPSTKPCLSLCDYNPKPLFHKPRCNRNHKRNNPGILAGLAIHLPRNSNQNP